MTNPHIPEWEAFFRAGDSFTAPVDAALLAKRFRGNTVMLAVAGPIAALSAVGIIVLMATGAGSPPAYIVVGFAAVMAGLMVLRTRWTRQRLSIAAASPNYLRISPTGVRVADTVELPWDLSIGAVVLRGEASNTGRQRLGGDLARSTGVALKEVVIGLAPGVAKPLRTAAGKQFRRLFEVIGEGGALRIPLDSVLSPQSVAQVTAAVQAAAPLAGVGAVGPEDIAAASQAVQELYLGKPLPAPQQSAATTVLIDQAVAVTSVASAASRVAASSSTMVAATALDAERVAAFTAAVSLFARALTAATPNGLVLKNGAVLGQDPAPSHAPAQPPLPFEKFARTVLTAGGQAVLAAAQRCLAEDGPDVFAERYPDLDFGRPGEGPDPVHMAIVLGQPPYARTIGWCDWNGEDEPGQVVAQVEEACRNFWQTVPFWGEAAGNDPVSLLRQADLDLQRFGQRLLLIDDGSDAYLFVPVRSHVYSLLAGRGGDGFALQGVDALG